MDTFRYDASSTSKIITKASSVLYEEDFFDFSTFAAARWRSLVSVRAVLNTHISGTYTFSSPVLSSNANTLGKDGTNRPCCLLKYSGSSHFCSVPIFCTLWNVPGSVLKTETSSSSSFCRIRLSVISRAYSWPGCLWLRNARYETRIPIVAGAIKLAFGSFWQCW